MTHAAKALVSPEAQHTRQDRKPAPAAGFRPSGGSPVHRALGNMRAQHMHQGIDYRCGCGGSCARCGGEEEEMRHAGAGGQAPGFRVTGGVSGITLQASATYADCSACGDGLEAIQVVWATGGRKVGDRETTIPPFAATYFTFVDGGQNSPGGATYSGNHPFYIGRPDLPATYGYNAAQGSAGSVSGCTANVFDRPTAALVYDEVYFETAIVCLDNSGQDEILEVFKWGFIDKGRTFKASPHSASAGLEIQSTPSAEFEATLAHDYPTYTHI